MKKTIYILSVFASFLATSQDLNNIYSYSLNWSNINNAYVGLNEETDILFMSRSQFNGVEGSPTNIMALGSFTLSNFQAIGLKMISDSRSIFNTSRIEGIYAQKFNLNAAGSYLRFGISFGVLNSSVDLNGINNRDAVIATGDPVLTSSELNYTHFISGAGAMINYNNISLGVSTPHLIDSNNGLRPLVITSAGYTYSIPGSDFAVKPSVLYQNRPSEENIADGFLNVQWRSMLSVIGGYTSDNRLRFGGSVDIKEFNIGYISERPTGSNIRSKSTHEIALKITLKSNRKKELQILDDDINQLLAETKELATGNYDKDYLRNRLIEIEGELDSLVERNSKANSKEIEVKLKELRGQILLIIQKMER